MKNQLTPTNRANQGTHRVKLSVNRHHHDKTVSNPKHYRDGFKTQELTING